MASSAQPQRINDPMPQPLLPRPLAFVPKKEQSTFRHSHTVVSQPPEDLFMTSSSSSSLPSSNEQEDDRHRRRAHDKKKERLLSLCNHIVHSSSTVLSKVLRGDVAPIVPAELFGQTLEQEIASCPFRNEDILFSVHPSLASTTSLQSIDNDKAQGDHHGLDFLHLGHRKLYGGAQYHRTLSQFHFLIHSVPIDPSTSDEIALLLYGISDASHDGNDILRSVAKLSSKKMETIMEDILDDMARRIEYVLLRMWDVVEYTLLVREDVSLGPTKRKSTQCYSEFKDNLDDDSDKEWESVMEKDLRMHAKEIYSRFLMEKCQYCYHMVKEDLRALFRFVSWDLAFGDRFQSTFDVDGCIIRVDGLEDDDSDDGGGEYSDGKDQGNEESHGKSSRAKYISNKAAENGSLRSRAGTILDPRTDEILRNVVEAVQSTVNRMGMGESMPQTCAAINVLVGHVTDRWRRDVSHIAMTKFNSSCMLPLHEEFVGYLRREMDAYVNQKFLKNGDTMLF